jgi:uncharacterized membrane protein YkvA (DUF1232 family)
VGVLGEKIMNRSSQSSGLQQNAGFISSLIQQGRLAWRLLNDGRVPGWVKLIPFAALLYFLSPIDLLPDWLLPGLGEVDDIVLILLALKVFVDLSPNSVVREHLENLLGGRSQVRPAPESSSDAYIDASYRVLDSKNK